MDVVIAGFWGAFFGTAALMLAGSLAAFARSQRRVALSAALSACISAFFAVAFLGGLPVGDDDTAARVLAHVAMLSAVVLALMLLSLLGWLRVRETALVAYASLATMASLVLGLGWALEAVQALALSSMITLAIGVAMLLVAMRTARRGDRQAWVAVAGISFMLASIAGLSWIALKRDVGWQVHAASALAGMAYLAVMASLLWSRYSFLLELAQVMAHGPAYDPVTRMRSHSGTGDMLGEAFFRRVEEERSVGIIVVSIANLYGLERLHGRVAVNHALFVAAGRLRRCVPANVEMGRLGDDGFLLLVRSADDARLARIARMVRERLTRPVVLRTGAPPEAAPELAQTEWRAEVGIGVLSAGPQTRPAQAVAVVRAMSRTAWTYASRMAWFDMDASAIAELPLADAR